MVNGKRKADMKVSINLKVDSEKKKKLIEEAHKRNLTLK